MSAPTGTASIEINNVTLTPGEKYATAKGSCIFIGEELEVEAYGRAAQELAANANSQITAAVKIIGGSKQPKIKVERIFSVAAPVIDDERIAQVRKTLTLKPKATKPEVLKAVEEAKTILG